MQIIMLMDQYFASKMVNLEDKNNFGKEIVDKMQLRRTFAMEISRDFQALKAPSQ